MNPVSTVEPRIMENLLAEAALRNMAADLIVAQDDNLQAGLDTRILHYDSEKVLLDVPSHHGRPVVLRPGQFVEVYVVFDHEHFGFDSRVIGYQPFQVNADTTVQALVIASPACLERRQRRKFYRVSVASLPPIAVELSSGDSPIIVHGRLCNVSAGGVAVVPDAGARRHFACDQRYHMRFWLRGYEQQFEFDAVVCHVRHVFQSKRQILGLAFLPGPNPANHREAIELIARFVAEQQREELFQRRQV